MYFCILRCTVWVLRFFPGQKTCQIWSTKQLEKAFIRRGNKCHLMATSLLREVTEPAVFVPEVVKQHDVFICTMAFGVVVSARASFWLDEITWKFIECFNKDLLKLALIPPTGTETNVAEHLTLLILKA